MDLLKRAIEAVGATLMLIGGVLFVGVFAVTLLNGKWPEFLSPIQLLFQIISRGLGDFAFVIEALLFVGPGWLVYQAAQLIKAAPAPPPPKR